MRVRREGLGVRGEGLDEGIVTQLCSVTYAFFTPHS